MYYKEIMENEEVIDVVLEKDMTAAKRRHKDFAKALRKQNICRNNYHFEWYNNLHQYSKNKIHCSCWLCAHHGPTLQDVKNQERMAYSEEEAGFSAKRMRNPWSW